MVVLFARVRVRVRLDISSVWFTCSNMVTHFRGSFFLLSFAFFFSPTKEKEKEKNEFGFSVEEEVGTSGGGV